MPTSIEHRKRMLQHLEEQQRQRTRIKAAQINASAQLTGSECDLLEWLSREDFSQYGECYGKDLDVLIAKGFAQVHGPSDHQLFIAKGDSQMCRAVSLTEAGWATITKQETA